jgi:hypothetical protein
MSYPERTLDDARIRGAIGEAGHKAGPAVRPASSLLSNGKGNPLMRYLAIGAVTLTALFTGYAVFYAVTTPLLPTAAQGAGMPAAQNLAPPVKGLYKGKEVLFIHTEASDPQVAEMLTMMMGPKVLLVPSLAKIPHDLLADVDVFTNGVKGGGPFGFQADVFSSVPGDPRYTPLRAVTLVAWRDAVPPRTLGSVEEIQEAARQGQVTLKQPSVVVNMPILVWPGGHR